MKDTGFLLIKLLLPLEVCPLGCQLPLRFDGCQDIQEEVIRRRCNEEVGVSGFKVEVDVICAAGFTTFEV